MSTRNLILLGKLQQPGKSLVALVEDHSILFSWCPPGSAIEPAFWELCPSERLPTATHSHFPPPANIQAWL
jgi:hypothetical protein